MDGSVLAQPSKPWEPDPTVRVPLAVGLRRGLRAALLVAFFKAWGWLPFGPACALGRALGSLLFRVAGGLRRRAVRQLREAYPERDEAWALATTREMLRHFGQTAAEVAQEGYSRRHILELVEYPPECRQVVFDALAEGRGAVVVTGHIGNWEQMARRATREHALWVVAREMNTPLLTRWMDRMRGRAGVGTFWRRPGRRILADLPPVLATNVPMTLLVDQDTRSRSVFVPFFGRLASTPRGCGELVLATGAPLLAAWVHRLPGNRHRITVERVPLPGRTGDHERDVQAIVGAATAAMERAIRENPAEWVWFHKRWKTRPPDGQAG